MTQQRFARFAWIVVAANLLVILWGAYVRATGSGAGCGNNWPLCNGSVVPRAASMETMIEFSHRTSSGLALLLVVVLVWQAYRLYPPGHHVRRGAMATFVIILIEAGLGAGLVLFELVADNASMARAMFLAIHLGNTFLLLAAMTLTAHWANGYPPVEFGLRAPRRRPLHALAWGTLAFTTLVGMSGAVAALGDTLFPATSLLGGVQQTLSVSSHILIQLRLLHPLIAISGGCLMLYLVARVRRLKRPETRYWANMLNVLVLVQLTVGSLNMVLHAPVAMQLFHLVLADFVWISLVLTCANALPKEENARVTAPSPAGSNAPARTAPAT